MQTTRQLLALALALLLLSGWLIAGRVGVGAALAAVALAVTVYALAREVGTEPETIDQARSRRTGVPL